VLTALLRHRIRRSAPGRYFQAKGPVKAATDANWSANYLAEKFYRDLAKRSPEKKGESPRRPAIPTPTTVAEIVRTFENSLEKSLTNFSRAVTASSQSGSSNQVLHLTHCGDDIVEHFCNVMDTTEISALALGL
jgi:hypothetical protein